MKPPIFTKALKIVIIIFGILFMLLFSFVLWLVNDKTMKETFAGDYKFYKAVYSDVFRED